MHLAASRANPAPLDAVRGGRHTPGSSHEGRPRKTLAAPGNTLALKVKTVQGQELTIATAGGVKADGANVVQTDIKASNGVIHVIDTVVLPK